MRSRFRSFAIFALTVFAERPAYACRCSSPPICEAFWVADAVFSGTAIAESEGQVTRFRVDEPFRGVRRDEVLDILPIGFGPPCAYYFKRGGRYMVFAKKGPNGELPTGLCTRTGPLEQAKDDITYARATLKQSGKPARVYGSLWVMGEGPLQQPATVTLHGGAYSVSSLAQVGWFEFDRVAPGKYRLSIAPPDGFQTEAPTVTVDANGPGACVRKTFNLSRQ